MKDFSVQDSIDNEFRYYRQTGINVSLTIAGLAGIIFKSVYDKFYPKLFCGWVVVSLICLSIAIFGGLLVQVSHYMGYRHMARRHYPEKGREPAEWATARWNSGNYWFWIGDCSVWLSASFLFFGFFISGLSFYKPPTG